MVLHWRHWDGEWVVFDEASGQTHQLDAVGTAVLGSFGPDALSDDHLVALASETLGLDAEASGQLAQRLPELLAAFATLGLIERLPT